MQTGQNSIAPENSLPQLGQVRWGSVLIDLSVLWLQSAPALGALSLPRQDRKALRKPGFPFRKVGSRRFGLEPRKPGPGFAGWGFLLVHRTIDGDPNLLIPFPTAWLGLENCASEIAI